MAAVPSRIGIELSDGTIKSVYHYSAGYPRILGRNLNYHYSTEDKANSLIDGGDMHNCWTQLQWSLEGYIYHNTPAPDYYSYRNIDLPPKIHQNIDNFLNYCVEENMEYAYIFSSEWKCYKIKFEDSPKFISKENYMDDPNVPV